MFRNKRLFRQFGSVLMLAVVAASAYAQSSSCVTTYPECSDTIEVYRDVECNVNGDEWVITDPVPYYMYACANSYSGCGGSSGAGVCNVMVRFQGMGRTITCPGGASSFCMEGVTSSVNLNKNCSGGPCAVPNSTSDTPHGYPPADNDFLDETNPWDVLPAPSTITAPVED